MKAALQRIGQQAFIHGKVVLAPVTVAPIAMVGGQRLKFSALIPISALLQE
jgi:hypothetical protein